ncbi:uncharacterized protein LOC123532370 [Mercenaria mercenaria]|uniref:uncharacterized protein LOC123532370 n=1 Tax=Mercenaria mercenaria TaxID=6596 RepID=UPI00234F08C4|nr:uncharacterized protein LOC123532370 [Mercenaria mercenaria]
MHSRQSMTSISSANFQQQGIGIVVQQSVHRSYSQDSGLNFGAYPGDIRMNPLYAAEPEDIEIQPQIRGFGRESAALANLPKNVNSRQNVCPSSPLGIPQDEDEVPTSNSPSAGCGIQNNCFTVFKRVFSALLIIGDVLIDWTSLADVIKGTVSNESTLTKNEQFTFSFPAFDDAALNSSSAETDNCGSSTFKLTISYGGFVIFGSVFALVKLLNIVGETRREICEKNPKYDKRDNKSQKNEKKKQKSFGFQLLHGWVETFFALLFEDLPQNFLLLLYSMSCKSNALNKTKTFASMIGSFVKNVFRKSTCKQKTGCVCCLYAFDIGCMNFTCLACVVCSCCSSANNYYPDGSLVKVKEEKWRIEDAEDHFRCCECVELEWGCEVDFPPVCSCGRCVLIEQMGCCNNKFESKCCELECCRNGCCGKRIDKDPIWLQKYITLCYLINIAIFILHVLGTNLADMFGL